MKCFYKIEDNSLVIDNAFDYASGSRTVRASDRINNFYVFLPKQGDITQNVSVLGVFKRQDGKVSIPKAMHYSGDETVDGVEFVKFEMAMQPFDLFLSGQLEVNVKVVYPDGTSQLSSIELFTIESANDAICDETLDSTCVDEVLGLIATKANVSDTGLSENLITDDKSNIVAGVNEVKDIASRLDISVDEFDTRIGSLDGLETDNKTDIVHAVNEVKGGVDGIHNIIDNSYNFYIAEVPQLYSNPDNPPLNQTISLNEIIGLNEEITLKIGDYLWITFYNNEGYSKIALYTIYAIGASYATGRILNAMPSISTLTYQEVKDIISSVDALRKISDLQDDTLTNPINLSSVSNIAYKDRDGLEIKDTYSKIEDIQNNLDSEDTSKPLSAKQGNILREMIAGKQFGAAFGIIEEMVTDLNSANADKYRPAYNFYIVDLNVPDFWVTEVLDNKTVYTYTTDKALIDAVKQAPVQIGHYKVSMLETAKVDIDGYVKETRKIADITLENDITAPELKTALEVPELPSGKDGQVLAFDDEGNIIAGAPKYSQQIAYVYPYNSLYTEYIPNTGLWFKLTSVNGNFNIYTGVNNVIWYSTLLTNYASRVETSPKGVENCIKLNIYENLVFNTQTANLEILAEDAIRAGNCYFDLIGMGRGILNSILVNSSYLYKVDELERLILIEQNSGLPDYWITHLNTKIPTIRNRQMALGKDCFSFAFVTDMHYNRSSKYSPKLLNEISKQCDIKFCINGGDEINQSFVSKDNAIDTHVELFNDFKNAGVIDKLLTVFGNHDDNTQTRVEGQVSSELALFPNDTYSLMFRYLEDKRNVTVSTDGKYYFADDTVQKVRYIVLNSSDSVYSFDEGTGLMTDSGYITYAYRQDQIDWFANIALNLPNSEWSVIIVSHIPPIKNGVVGYVEMVPHNNSCMVGILEAFKNKTSYSYTSSGVPAGYEVSLSVNFADKPGDAILWASGHTHADNLVFLSNGIPVFTTTHDALMNYTGYTEQQIPTKTEGTITEHAFDIVTIDKINKTCYLTRIGAGSDRSFEY